MKTVITILFFITSIIFSQQPTYLNSGDFGNNWNDPQAMTSSLGNSYIVTKTSGGTGTRYFRFASGTSGWTNFGPAANPTAISFGTKLSISTTGTDNNCTLEAANTTDNIVFKTNDIKELVAFRIQGDIQTLASTSRIPSGVVFQATDVKIMANLSGSLPTGQGVYLRFCINNNWGSSTVREMTGSGSTYSTYIYQSETGALGRTFNYYLFTSGSSLTIPGSDADLYTINYLNNGGANYSFTTSEIIPNRAQSSGNWDNSSTWSKGTVPSSSDNVIINRDVTLNTSASIASLTINDGNTLTSENGQLRTLTIGSGGDFNNNGTFTANDGMVEFNGMNTVCGEVTFNYVDIRSNYIDFGPSSTITGRFRIRSGGTVVNNPPTYADNSILYYMPGGSRVVSTEWRTNAAAGKGVPYNVQVQPGTINTSLQFSGSASWSLRGNLYVADLQTLILSSSSGGDLYVKDGFLIDGTLFAAGIYNREIILEGSSTQTVRCDEPIEYLKIDNSGTGISLDGNLTVSKRLMMNKGNFNCNGNVMFISNGIADDNSENGIVRNSGIIYNSSPNKFKRTIGAGNAGNYLFPVGTSSIYCPCNLQYTTPSTVNRNIFADMTYGDGGTGISEINDAGYTVNTRSNSFWQISVEGGSGLDGVAILSLTNPNLTGIGSPEDLRIVISSGESFTFAGNHTSGSGTTAKRTINITATGITGTYYIGGNSSSNPLPVELSSFAASESNGKILLNWQTTTEIDNYGFEIERTPTSVRQALIMNGIPDKDRGWEKIGFIKGSGNSNSNKFYEFIDDNFTGGSSFLYRLKMIDNDGSYGYSNEVEVSFGLPQKFSLEQNYPNPFNPSTKIKFSIPQASYVRLQVYDAIGKMVNTLVSTQMKAGFYEVDFNAYSLPSGIYFYRLITDKYTEVQKMILAK